MGERAKMLEPERFLSRRSCVLHLHYAESAQLYKSHPLKCGHTRWSVGVPQAGDATRESGGRWT